MNRAQNSIKNKNANSSIVSEKSGLRSHEQGNKTWSLLTKRVASRPDLSPQDEFVIHHKTTTYAILCISFLICVFNPYALYGTDITQFDSTQTMATLGALFGVFLTASFIAIYATSFIPKRFAKIPAFIFSLALFIGLIYSFILVGDYGAMDRFVFNKPLFFYDMDFIIGLYRELVIVVVVGAFLIALLQKWLIYAWKIVLLTLIVVSSANLANILYKVADSMDTKYQITHSAKSTKAPYEDELFSYSKTQKNIVVFVLDMFSGSHTPYILEQFPHLKNQLDGFTHFPNAISSSNATIYTMPSIIGGEYYTIYNMNKRGDNHAQAEANAYKSTALAFANTNGGGGESYKVSYLVFPIANKKDLPSDLIWVDSHLTFKQYFLAKHPHLDAIIEENKHYDIARLLNFGLLKFTPKLYRRHIYNDGQWLWHRHKIDSHTIISYASTLYAATHILNATSTMPTFKFIHSMITHNPFGIRYHNGQCEYLTKQNSHFDTEACALHYLANFVKSLKALGIYDNTQIFVVSDHGGNDSINMPQLTPRAIGADTLFLFKDFSAKGAIRTDNRLMANYDIASIFCANLTRGCPNVGQNILENYPQRREIIHARPNDDFNRHKPNLWLIDKAYKVRGDINNAKNWSDISDAKYGIVNIK